LEIYAVRGYEIHTTFLFDILIPLWDSEASPYPCGKRIAAVFPDGTIGPCIRNHSYKTGTIYDNNPMEKIQCDLFHHGLIKMEFPEECKACESRNVCRGGCPNDKILLTGSVSGKSVFCDIHKEIIPRIKHLDKTIHDLKLKPFHL
jgi:uncharacterized protein